MSKRTPLCGKFVNFEMLLNIANISEKTAYFYLFFDDLKNGLKLIKHNKTNQMDFHNEKINKFRVYYRK